MDIKDVDLNLLIAFDVIYDELSVTRAASRLGMSQSALSSALNRLRTSIGDPLFQRTSHGVRPTPRAIQLAGPVKGLLEQAKDLLQEQWAFELSSAELTFTVAMSDYTEIVILPRIMSWLKSVAPGVDLVVAPLVEESLADDLKNGSIDLAIGYLPYLDGLFPSDHLVTATFVSVVRSDFTISGENMTLDEYLSHPHVAPRLRGNRLTGVERALHAMGLKRRVALRTINFSTIPHMVSRTGYIGDLPLRIARHNVQQHSLRVLVPPLEMEGAAISQFWHESKNQDSASIWLRRSIKEICRIL